MTLATNIALSFGLATKAFMLPPGLLSAVCWVESLHNPTAINVNDRGSPSIGICQIKWDTAKLLGFKGTAQKLLSNYRLNIHYAAKYLHKQLGRYDDDVDAAIAAYNAGSASYNKRGLLKNRIYVARVHQAWKEKR